ncbi:broad-complex core protein isoforms 1/2/3/4/5 isoform X4 [Monomorium pharaonis]|uniref:broad-complex core protein isoforms 1/2/3/4/5 isoform X4 n=1 Tax=Monomorium pharaonis TaxID=307658 RepID=UPI00063ED416|nr:broad-complex core protein isoforms 1/2/3/4/5 isoform X4 [Monomorium pharaonis]XP_012541876.1 broad-complex core protein isoforms 1/2/3/4/5 isoform X4 [Monomorium pharaonis]
MAASSSSSTGGEQQYSLRWNDFQSSILSSVRQLRDVEDFVDVTLACDSCSFTAHKIVLSACSPYFRNLLKANPCPHPIVILKDVASSDMESLLRFMYHGEVHVGQEQLPAFLKTAQMLQVRGLADVNSGATKIPSSSAGNNGSAPATPRNWQDNGRGDLNDSESPPEKRARSYSPPMGNHVEQKSDLQESLLGQALEGGPTIHTASSNNIQAQSTGEDSNSMSENEEDMSNHGSILNAVKTEPSDILNDSIEHHRNSFPAALLSLQGMNMPGPSGMHQVANQDPNYGSAMPKREEAAMAATATDTTQAVENFARLYTVLRHDDTRPLCRYCGRSYSSPSNLRQHVKNVHSNWPPPDTWPQCNVCGKRCKTKHYLINHQLQAHGIHQRPSMNNPVTQQQQQQQLHQSPSSSSLP